MIYAIPLTQNKIALVDQEDYGRLAQFSWYAYRERKSGRWYARRTLRVGGKGGTLDMHRAVLEAPDDTRVDHVRNEHSLDNRRANLRFATASQNGANRGLSRNNKSGYKGIVWFPDRHQWCARITLSRKRICLGYYESKLEAARAYDMAALKLFGKFARLNFPDEVAAA